MVKPNKTKAKVQAGGVAFGASVSPHEAGLVELAGLLGFDYVVIDWEHYLFDARMVEECIRAAELRGLTPIVRMQNNPERIQHLLNAGAQGVLIARVNDANDVRAILAAAKFHPEGKRTVFYNGRGGDFGLAVAPGESRQWTLDTNRETLIGCIIEEITGVNELANILAFPEIDMIHLGPWDLAHSMGWPPQDEVGDLGDKIVSEATKAGKAMSTTWGGSADKWSDALAKGYRMFTVSPRGYFKTGGAQFLRQVKEIAASKGMIA
jgi:staphyloferrin B biosynthesis citrate synthase